MNSGSDFSEPARKQAQGLSEQLISCQTERVVFAESCTAGLVAALLGQYPGISNFLCGSAVTYRESVKTAWLGVSEQSLERLSAESVETTNEMASGVLAKTAEATIAVAVTGHLGPNAPEEIDGKIFVSVARRGGQQNETHRSGETNIKEGSDAIDCVSSESHRLKATVRVDRQYEAAHLVLATTIKFLNNSQK